MIYIYILYYIMILYYIIFYYIILICVTCNYIILNQLIPMIGTIFEDPRLGSVFEDLRSAYDV